VLACSLRLGEIFAGRHGDLFHSLQRFVNDSSAARLLLVLNLLAFASHNSSAVVTFQQSFSGIDLVVLPVTCFVQIDYKVCRIPYRKAPPKRSQPHNPTSGHFR
jgi:hypothetical protein